MKTRETQGIILNYLKQDGFSMQTEHGYVLSRTNLTIRSPGNMPLFLMILQSVLRYFHLTGIFYCFETPDLHQL